MQEMPKGILSIASFIGFKVATKPKITPSIIGRRIRNDSLNLWKRLETAEISLSKIFSKTAVVPPEAPGTLQDKPMPTPLKKSINQAFKLAFLFFCASVVSSVLTAGWFSRSEERRVG